MPEFNFKVQFAERYFDKSLCRYDVHFVDLILLDEHKMPTLYLEAKWHLMPDTDQWRQALAQIIITNKRQKITLCRVALIYRDNEDNDILDLVDCSDDSVMYNNDFNWKAEIPSTLTRDAVDRINDRLTGHITRYKNDEIRELYALIRQRADTIIQITKRNINVVYNQWKATVQFQEEVADEQDLINLFLVDLLNGTKYKQTIVHGGLLEGTEQEEPLIREGTNLSHYEIIHSEDKIRFLYNGKDKSVFYTIADSRKYEFFWKKYKRPPEKDEFLKILERSATLYSEKYRRDTGGEYTPSCFVTKQNEILAEHYNLDEFIVCDPCAGVGNLENQFGKDYKQYCYLSTLEQMDVDICQIKGFENSVQFDYLRDETQPKWKYKGTWLDIREICQREGRKLMIVMNPPYQRKPGYKYDMVLEFFLKVLTLNPSVIVYYTKTEFFFRDTVSLFVNSGYKIVSHIFSNASTIFQLSQWPVSQVIFDRQQGQELVKEYITADRYEYDAKSDRMEFIRSYTYDNARPNLIEEIEKKIKENSTGLVLGQWSYLGKVLIISNGGKEKKNKITSDNLKWCLLSKGINFNSHAQYFEWNYLVYRGRIEDISEELFTDAIMFGLFYKNNMFTNKGQKNYLMPFRSTELGCRKNDLNVLFPEDKLQSGLFCVGVSSIGSADSIAADGDSLTGSGEGVGVDGGKLTGSGDGKSMKEGSEAGGSKGQTVGLKPAAYFDFREFMQQFSFSKEARDLYAAALQVFRFYHKSLDYAQGRDWNDSFYDITNAIMGKDVSSFKTLDNYTGITRVKTTKGSRGFGRKTIKYAVSSKYWDLFEAFFDARDVLAKKINRQLVDSGLLLWERENIY